MKYYSAIHCSYTTSTELRTLEVTRTFLILPLQIKNKRSISIYYIYLSGEAGPNGPLNTLYKRLI